MVFYWDYDEPGVHGGEKACRNQYSADRPRWSDDACAVALQRWRALGGVWGYKTRTGLCGVWGDNARPHKDNPYYINTSLAQLAHSVLEQHGRRPVHDLVYDARDGHHAVWVLARGKRCGDKQIPVTRCEIACLPSISPSLDGPTLRGGGENE